MYDKKKAKKKNQFLIHCRRHARDLCLWFPPPPLHKEVGPVERWVERGSTYEYCTSTSRAVEGLKGLHLLLLVVVAVRYGSASEKTYCTITVHARCRVKGSAVLTLVCEPTVLVIIMPFPYKEKQTGKQAGRQTDRQTDAGHRRVCQRMQPYRYIMETHD